MKRARLQAQLTGKASTRTRDVGPEEAHYRNVRAINKRIDKRDGRIKQILRELKGLRMANRADRRELRAVLQRDSRVTESDVDVIRFAGRPDAIDISSHRRERETVKQTTCRHCGQDIEGFAPFDARTDWRDRGNNQTCPSGPRAGERHQPYEKG